jgi:hypothetical protein
MSSNFIEAHVTLAYLGMACFLAISGYGLSRLFPESPGNACSSWFMALLFLGFGLAGAKILRPIGPVLAVAAGVGGFVWVVRYYDRHRPH